MRNMKTYYFDNPGTKPDKGEEAEYCAVAAFGLRQGAETATSLTVFATPGRN